MRHLTTIEQYWFVEGIAGLTEPYPYFDGDEEDWDWELDRSEGLQPDVDRYVALVERARQITADLDLDATITTKHGRTLSHRRVMLGLVAEYARHNVHADVIRELIMYQRQLIVRTAAMTASPVARRPGDRGRRSSPATAQVAVRGCARPRCG